MSVQLGYPIEVDLDPLVVSDTNASSLDELRHAISVEPVPLGKLVDGRTGLVGRHQLGNLLLADMTLATYRTGRKGLDPGPLRQPEKLPDALREVSVTCIDGEQVDEDLARYPGLLSIDRFLTRSRGDVPITLSYVDQ